MNLWHLVDTGIGAHKVRCDATNNALYRPFTGVDSDTLRRGDRRICSAEPPHVYISIIVDKVDCHSDLIGMAGKRQSWASTLVQHGNTVAVSIGIRFISILVHIVHPNTQAFRFMTRWTWSIDQTF